MSETRLREDMKLAESGTSDGVEVETVEIPVGEDTLVANYYRPQGASESQPAPAAVVGGSLTSVKEMMGGNYARALAKRGLAALAVDYRDYGGSDGKPRFFEDPARKLDDLEAAAGWLKARPEVTRAGALGVCTSGGNIMYAGAAGGNVEAVATVAGWFAEPAITPDVYGGEDEVKDRREAGKAARAEYERTGEVETITAYPDTDKTASHVGPMEYYMSEERGGGVEAYDNKFAVMSWGPWMDFDPVRRASDVSVPTLVVHSDDSAFPDQAKKVHEALGDNGSLHWGEGAHFDFYDRADLVNEAADAVADHFRRHLG